MNKKWHKSKIDQNQLRIEIQEMSPQSKLFQLLKEEISKIGYWHKKPRGNPKKGYLVSRQGNGK
ncbi:MAG TPA: hypothetical protein VMQ58_01885 [Candidatus Saccharimonadales bacterium]|nr:hypothetical protein [Candidatus Saccharimonadales bacterium]